MDRFDESAILFEGRKHISDFTNGLLNVLSFGLFHCICRLSTRLDILLKTEPCPLDQADCVILQDQYGIKRVVKICTVKVRATLTLKRYVKDGRVRILDSQYGRFIYDYLLDKFILPTFNITKRSFEEIYKTLSQNIEAELVDRYEKEVIYGKNVTSVKIASTAEILLNNIVEPFFIWELLSFITWIAIRYYKYAAVVGCIYFVMLLVNIAEDIRKRRALRRSLRSSTVRVLRNDSFVEECETELLPGDLIYIDRTDSFTCDAEILRGSVITDESFLTGESVPICKGPGSTVFSGTKVIKSSQSSVSLSNQHLEKLVKVRSLIKSPTEQLVDLPKTKGLFSDVAVGLVIRTGKRTKRSTLLINLSTRKPTTNEFTKQSERVIRYLIFGAILLMCGFISYFFGSLPLAVNLEYSSDVALTFFSPALYTCLQLGIQHTRRELARKGINTTDVSRINTAGEVDLIVFDKTGTLTELGVDILGFDTIDRRFEAIHKIEPLARMALSTCHYVVELEDQYSGDVLDMKMFLFSETKIINRNGKRFIQMDSKRQLKAICKEYTDSEHCTVFFGGREAGGTTGGMSDGMAGGTTGDMADMCSGTTGDMADMCSGTTTVADMHSKTADGSALGAAGGTTGGSALTSKTPGGSALTSKTADGDVRLIDAVVATNAAASVISGTVDVDSVPTTIESVVQTPTDMPGADPRSRSNAQTTTHEDDLLTNSINLSNSIGDDCHTLEILKIHDFDMFLKRISVIVKDHTGRKYLFCKGAPDSLQSILKSVPGRYTEFVRDYGLAGCRVLSVAWREISGDHGIGQETGVDSTHDTRDTRQSDEEGLEFLGFLVFANRLKEETSGVIRELRVANLSPKMCTGDNILTAISVARECGMIDTAMPILFPVLEDGCKSCYDVDWYSTAHEQMVFDKFKMVLHSEKDNETQYDFVVACESKEFAFFRGTCFEKLLFEKGVVFARFNPDNKKELIEAYSKRGYVTMFCGDGANDTGALCSADVGLSLATNEASLAASFNSLSLASVLDVVKEGRSALSMSAAQFKYIFYSQVLAGFQIIALFPYGLFPGDGMSLINDLMSCYVLGYSLSTFRAARTISPVKFPCTVVKDSYAIIVELLFTLFIFSLANIFIFEPNLTVKITATISSKSKKSTVIFFSAMLLLITKAFVFADFGAYREKRIKNRKFIAYILACLAFFFAILISFLKAQRHVCSFFFFSDLENHEIVILFLCLITTASLSLIPLNLLITLPWVKEKHR